ncbi:MAG: hypothetical protein HC889_19345 [Synechococcaceae cyanobacterium SM1_2_3]|nr:hypothetical protein [Synechococcaceae cyanobacterium SM1_2_3]
MDWQPEASTYELLAKQGIAHGFAESCIDEFRLYWQEIGERHPGWETTFPNSIKRSWKRQQSSNPATAPPLPHTTNPRTSPPRANPP